MFTEQSLHHFERNPNDTDQWLEYLNNTVVVTYELVTYDNYQNVIIYNKARDQYVQLNATRMVTARGSIDQLDDPDYFFVGEWKSNDSWKIFSLC